MDASNENFSAELALAVTVWRAVSKNAVRGASPKKAIERWIDAHPRAWLGEGTLSESAVDRITTLVNWRKKGGASTTAGK